MFYIMVAANKKSLERHTFSGSFWVNTGASFKPIPGRSLLLRNISLLKLHILEHGVKNAA